MDELSILILLKMKTPEIFNCNEPTKWTVDCQQLTSMCVLNCAVLTLTSKQIWPTKHLELCRGQ